MPTEGHSRTQTPAEHSRRQEQTKLFVRTVLLTDGQQPQQEGQARQESRRYNWNMEKQEPEKSAQQLLRRGRQAETSESERIVL